MYFLFLFRKKTMYKAIKDRIIVEPDKMPDSSIILLNETPCISGTVIDIGSAVTDVKIHDHIVFHCYDEIKLPIENRIILREKSVLGIIPKENNNA